MKGEEFIEKILAGKTNFSYIILEEKFELSCHPFYNKILNYLKNKNLEKKPIILDHSQLRFLKAERLYLPFVQAMHVDFYGAKLPLAYFYKGNFTGTDFSNADLSFVDLSEANLKNSNFYNADLTETNLSKADLRGVKNLQTVKNLTVDQFYKTIITPNEKKILREILLPEKELFDIRKSK